MTYKQTMIEALKHSIKQTEQESRSIQSYATDESHKGGLLIVNF